MRTPGGPCPPLHPQVWGCSAVGSVGYPGASRWVWDLARRVHRPCRDPGGWWGAAQGHRRQMGSEGPVACPTSPSWCGPRLQPPTPRNFRFTCGEVDTEGRRVWRKGSRGSRGPGAPGAAPASARHLSLGCVTKGRCWVIWTGSGGCSPTPRRAPLLQHSAGPPCQCRLLSPGPSPGARW